MQRVGFQNTLTTFNVRDQRNELRADLRAMQNGVSGSYLSHRHFGGSTTDVPVPDETIMPSSQSLYQGDILFFNMLINLGGASRAQNTPCVMSLTCADVRRRPAPQQCSASAGMFTMA